MTVKNIFLILTSIFLLTACASGEKPLKAPCTYHNRLGCGSVIPLQQTIDPLAVDNT